MSDRRVLLVLGPSDGGIRRHVACLRDGLRERGVEARVAGPAGVMDGLGGNDHDVPVGLGPASVVAGARRLRRLAADVDLVHAHGLKAAVTAAAAGVRPRLLTIHNVVLDGGIRSRALAAVERRVPGWMDGTIAVSAEIRDRFPASSGIVVVAPAGPAAVPDEDPSAVRERLGVGDAPLVVTVARLHPQKDLPTLLRAAVRVGETRPDVRFVVVGGGPDEAALVAERNRLGLGDRVQFVGQRPNAASELAAADVVAMSSVWEGSPLVVAEAMSLGRPVAATAVGAVPEVLVDGETGRLVPVGDDGALAAAIVDLLDDPETAQRLAAAGRVVADARFAPDVLVDGVVARYEDLW